MGNDESKPAPCYTVPCTVLTTPVPCSTCTTCTTGVSCPSCNTHGGGGFGSPPPHFVVYHAAPSHYHAPTQPAFNEAGFLVHGYPAPPVRGLRCAPLRSNKSDVPFLRPEAKVGPKHSTSSAHTPKPKKLSRGGRSRCASTYVPSTADVLRPGPEAYVDRPLAGRVMLEVPAYREEGDPRYGREYLDQCDTHYPPGVEPAAIEAENDAVEFEEEAHQQEVVASAYGPYSPVVRSLSKGASTKRENNKNKKERSSGAMVRGMEPGLRPSRR